MRKLFLLLGVVLLSMQLLAQQRTVTGKVTDVNGKPVFNATVLVKGTTMGTTTKEDGTFSLSVSPTAKVLVVSSVGLAPQEVGIGNRGVLLIALSPTDKDLQEVVVVGYGTQKKSDLTASVAKVNGDKVADVPLSSVDQVLQGKVAGLQSVTFSGQPGANQSVRIRGIGSYTASSQPLYVIDGIQINQGDLSRETTSTNVLAQLNPDDIESISVLKDAAGTSIYGARGSNGVIVITTKKGKSGKTKFSATAEAGTNKPGDIMKAGRPLRAKDWLTLYKEGYTNTGMIPTVTNPTPVLSVAQANAVASAANYGDGSVDIDWPSLLLKSGPQQQYNISASGGDAKTQFFVSGGYFKQIGTTIGEDLTRYSSVLNLDHQASSKLSFSFSFQPTYSRQNSFISNSSAFASPSMEFYFERPTSNPFNADGSYSTDKSSKGFTPTYNPLFIVANDIHRLDNTSMIGKAAGSYNILGNLKFTTSMGMQYNNLEEYQYNNPIHGDGAGAIGRGYAYYSRYILYDWTNQFSYHANLTKSKDLSLDLAAGTEAINSRGYFITASQTNYPTTLLVDAVVAATPTAGTNSGSDYNFASYFSRGSLSYKGKYILAGSFRRDGSSRFAPSNEYGNFPSGSFAWNVSKEDFMDNVKFLSDVKLRASYGSSGNAEIGNYTWRETYGYGLNYNNQPGGGFNNVGNVENLQWEHANMADVGIDASLFKNRVSLIVDYYNKKSDKLLFSAPLSYTSGFASYTDNIGAVTNKGIEVTINATPVSYRNFTWDLSFNFTHNKNEVTALPPGQTQIINGVQYVAPGHDIYEFYIRQWAGVDPATGNPLWYADVNKATTTTNYNAAYLGPVGKSASPKYYGGFSNTFAYKEFSISGDFYYNYGNYVRDQWASYLTDEVNPGYGKYTYTLRRWQKPGDITDVPKLVSGLNNTAPGVTNSSSASTSTRFLYKGDFIRLRNIVVSYNASQHLVNKLGLSMVKFYVRGTNLWTKVYDSKIPFDPEQGITSQSNLNVLYNKAITAGLSIGF